jgi:hypothetical protein
LRRLRMAHRKAECEVKGCGATPVQLFEVTFGPGAVVRNAWLCDKHFSDEKTQEEFKARWKKEIDAAGKKR